MYLFDRNGDKIDVYSMNPNKEKYVVYKKEEMLTVDVDERIYGIESNLNEKIIVPNSNLNVFLNKKPMDVYKDTIDYQFKNPFGIRYHELIPNYIPSYIKDPEEYLYGIHDNYVNYIGEDKQLVQVFEYVPKELTIEKYLIMPGDINQYYKTVKCKDSFFKKQIIEGIVSVPRSLYLLELLNQGHFSRIDENVAEQMELFDVSSKPIATYSLEELKEMKKNGISQDAYENAIHQVNECEKVLKYIK